MKNIYLIMALLFATQPHASTVWGSSATAFENEGIIRFQLARSGDTNLVQTVHYRTRDLDAKAGIDYLARTGTVTFALGQSAASVDIPLLDNPFCDGDRSFELIAENPSPGVEIGPNYIGLICERYWLGTIKDNEVSTTVDPLFVPDIAPGGDAFVAPMPDGRVLISGPNGITMLQANGWIDPTFHPGNAQFPGPFGPVHVFADGKILTWTGRYGTNRFIRLLPDGAVDVAFPVCYSNGRAPWCPSFLAAQPDGKILVSSFVVMNNSEKTVLRRHNLDGTEDQSFQLEVPVEDIGILSAVAVQPDNKILLGGIEDLLHKHPGLVRVNSDGSLDNTFARYDGSVYKIFVRTNGKILLLDWDGRIVLQLNSDGQIDPSFLPPNDFARGPQDQDDVPARFLLEQPDGRILLGNGRRLIRLNADGTRETTFAFNANWIPRPCQVGSSAGAGPSLTASGQLILGGRFDAVAGFPRRWLVRLSLDPPPPPDFRVVTGAEFSRSDAVATITVVRTCDTTGEAAVDFVTENDTAKAGLDYIERTGTLTFAPLEVSRTITVPLLGRPDSLDRLVFNLRLFNPSAGYTNAPPSPVVIRPDLQLSAESPRSGGTTHITLRGTVPGRSYHLESSSDLISWGWAPLESVEAAGNVTTFGPLTFSPPVNFFRAAAE